MDAVRELEKRKIIRCKRKAGRVNRYFINGDKQWIIQTKGESSDHSLEPNGYEEKIRNPDANIRKEATHRSLKPNTLLSKTAHTIRFQVIEGTPLR